MFFFFLIAMAEKDFFYLQFYNCDHFKVSIIWVLYSWESGICTELGNYLKRFTQKGSERGGQWNVGLTLKIS